MDEGFARMMRGSLLASVVLILAAAIFLTSASAKAQTCQTIPGTQTKVGAACLLRSQYPVLVNPVDPLSYGADATGVTNSAVAFQEAVNSGHDINVTCPTGINTCTYKISDAAGSGPVVISTKINIQCQPNVTLYNPDMDQLNSAMISFRKVSGGGVQGCNLIGANSGSAPLKLGGGYANFLIEITDSSNVLIEGNTFGATWSDAALKLDTGTTGPGATYTTIQFNTFNANPLYGVAITSGGYDTIQYNLLIDSNAGVEANANEAMTGHILITQNMEIYQHGGCEAAGDQSCNFGIGFSGGGTVDDYKGKRYTKYSTNSVTKNYCTGTGIQHAEIYDTWNSYVSPPPTYSNNTLGPGCTCDSGAGSC